MNSGIDYVSDDGFMYIAWHISDVQLVRPDLSDDQARNVLDTVINEHDAEVGVNWDVLRYWAEHLYGETDETQARTTCSHLDTSNVA